jgi:cobalt transporter subunit CbtA
VPLFARIVAGAAIAGVVAGLLLTGLQQIEIAPMLRDAEVREAAAAREQQSTTHAADAPHWAPVNGVEQLAATAIANVALGVGFALLLGAAMVLHGHSGWRPGLLWGLAGFAVLYVAPSLGLPPELPGADAAPLQARTMWWVGTVAASATGLWVVVFARSAALRIAGIALIVAPHLIGAPLPATNSGIVPAEAARRFVRAAALVNGAFWIALGVLLGIAQRRGSAADGAVVSRPHSPSQ